MGRPFDFTPKVKWEAMLRQKYRCGHCGGDLRELLDAAHHVIPNQSGNPSDLRHQWLRTAVNCIFLCDDCHERVHADGNYRTGGVAPPNYYKFSHGGDAGAHRQWVATLDGLTKSVWGRAP